MPGFPVAACETSFSRSSDQPSHQDACAHLSTEERLAAEESLLNYCQPVELYNVLQQRARRMPLFRQKSLIYKIKAKKMKRIQMTVSLAWKNKEAQTVFPLYVCLAKREPDNEDADYSAVYRISRTFFFRGPSGTNGNNQIQADFLLPEVYKLAVEEDKSGSHVLLFFTTVYNPNLSSRINANMRSSDLTSHESRPGENCLCGKLSLGAPYMVWDCSPNFSLGQRVDFVSIVNLLPSILKYDVQSNRNFRKGQIISFQDPRISEEVSKPPEIRIRISAKTFEVKDRSPYLPYASNDDSSLSRIIQLKEGNVTFNYRYHKNKLHKTEVTEDFTCPFCLVKCGSYKGLGSHLLSSHDRFNFEFSASEDCQVVDVSVQTDNWKFVADGIDPKVQTFFFCAKPFKRRSPKVACSENAKDADPPVLAKDADPPVLAKDADPPVLAEDVDPPVLAEDAHPPVLADDATEIPEGDTELLKRHDGVSNASIVSNDPDRVPPISENGHGTPVLPQVDRTGRLPEHSDQQIIHQLQKRKFYHSQKLQPMSLEEVLSDHDSEDEDDDGVADIEEKIKLDRLDVSKEEKRFLFMWNTFIRKQRVLADAHIPWACKAFSKSHGPELVSCPKLHWCWRLYRIKLYNHGLINAQIIDECTTILQEYEKENSNSNS